jgi:hypothetical protein
MLLIGEEKFGRLTENYNKLRALLKEMMPQDMKKKLGVCKVLGLNVFLCHVRSSTFKILIF